MNLKEMTMKVGNLTPTLQKIFEYYSKIITVDDLVHLGDIGSIKVMRFELSKSKTSHKNDMPQIVDFLINNDDKIGMMIGDKLKVNSNSKMWKDGHKSILEIKEWFIVEPRTGLGEKYLYFLKNVMKTPLLLGNVHSVATQEFLKKHDSLGRFKLSWYNIDTGEIEKFDDDKYSFSSPSKWQTLIESDNISTFNKFTSDIPSIRNNYDWLFEL